MNKMKMEIFTEKLMISESEIVPPHDFHFQYGYYVIPPERQEDDALIKIVRLGDDKLAKVEIRSIGTVEHPCLELTVKSSISLSYREMFEIREQASWQLCLTDALRPFYEICKGDPIMEMAISMHYGAKDKGRFSLFEAIIDCICAQNVIFKRLYTMMDNLCKRFGDKVEIEGRVYHAFPTPMQLASATLDEIRLCGVGYRAKFIKNFAEMVACGEVNLEKIKKLPINEAIEELMQIEGVGPYTANLSMILAMRRREILHLDSFVREILSQLYFEGRKVSDEELQTFAAQRWLGCQAYATLLLCTDTEMLFRNVGKEFRLKSGARR